MPENQLRATVEAAQLWRALREVRKVCKAKTYLPVLRNVHLEAEGECLRVTCTDLDSWETRTIPARHVVCGATTVNARLLHDLARELRSMGTDPILLELVPYGDPRQETIGHKANTYEPITRQVQPIALLMMARAFGFTAHLAAIEAAEFPPMPLPAVEVAA